MTLLQNKFGLWTTAQCLFRLDMYINRRTWFNLLRVKLYRKWPEGKWKLLWVSRRLKLFWVRVTEGKDYIEYLTEIQGTSILLQLCSWIIFIHSFIRLADYLIVNTMHVLAANSVATLLNYLEEQLQHTPSPSQIQGTTEETESEGEKSEGEGVEQKVFFVLLPTNAAQFILWEVEQNKFLKSGIK